MQQFPVQESTLNLEFTLESKYVNWQAETIPDGYTNISFDGSTATIARTGVYLVYAQV